jgi:hypothetical protein
VQNIQPTRAGLIRQAQLFPALEAITALVKSMGRYVYYGRLVKSKIRPIGKELPFHFTLRLCVVDDFEQVFSDSAEVFAIQASRVGTDPHHAIRRQHLSAPP